MLKNSPISPLPGLAPEEAEAEEAVPEGLEEEVDGRNPIRVAIDAIEPGALAFEDGGAEAAVMEQVESGADEPGFVRPDEFGTGERACQKQVEGKDREEGDPGAMRSGVRGASYWLRFLRQAAIPMPAMPITSKPTVPGSGVMTESELSARSGRAAARASVR